MRGVDAVRFVLQRNIHQHQIGMKLRDLAECFLCTVRSAGHLVTELTQELLERRSDDVLRFDDQDSSNHFPSRVIRSTQQELMERQGEPSLVEWLLNEWSITLDPFLRGQVFFRMSRHI